MIGPHLLSPAVSELVLAPLPGAGRPAIASSVMSMAIFVPVALWAAGLGAAAVGSVGAPVCHGGYAASRTHRLVLRASRGVCSVRVGGLGDVSRKRPRGKVRLRRPLPASSVSRSRSDARVYNNTKHAEL